MRVRKNIYIYIDKTVGEITGFPERNNSLRKHSLTEIFCFILALEVETTQLYGHRKEKNESEKAHFTCDEITIYVFINFFSAAATRT